MGPGKICRVGPGAGCRVPGAGYLKKIRSGYEYGRLPGPGPATSRELVTHFKRCELQHKIPSILKQDICTRWNSTYDILWSIWLNFEDVEQVLEIRNEGTYIGKIDRYIIKDITDLLSIFKIGSEKLSADDVPTIHSVLPWLSKFKKSCEAKDTDRLCIALLKKN
jgi:hypothetical protein